MGETKQRRTTTGKKGKQVGNKNNKGKGYKRRSLNIRRRGACVCVSEYFIIRWSVLSDSVVC